MLTSLSFHWLQLQLRPRLINQEWTGTLCRGRLPINCSRQLRPHNCDSDYADTRAHTYIHVHICIFMHRPLSASHIISPPASRVTAHYVADPTGNLDDTNLHKICLSCHIVFSLSQMQQRNEFSELVLHSLYFPSRPKGRFTSKKTSYNILPCTLWASRCQCWV